MHRQNSSRQCGILLRSGKGNAGKGKGLETAIAETKRDGKGAKRGEEKTEKLKESVKVKREKEWYEKFHWFNTSGNRLAIGGKDAQQNDLVFARYMDEGDLFFHADIQGGSVVILKDGTNASEQEKKEAAQFAASFSNAWKNGNASVDVYAVQKSQISKHATGGYIPTGAFAITGSREWFRKTTLGLRLGKTGKPEIAVIVPQLSEKKLGNMMSLVPMVGGKEKGELAKPLAKKLGVHPDELLQILPSGKNKVV